jgi:hypothetical protein
MELIARLRACKGSRGGAKDSRLFFLCLSPNFIDHLADKLYNKSTASFMAYKLILSVMGFVAAGVLVYATVQISFRAFVFALIVIIVFWIAGEAH